MKRARLLSALACLAAALARPVAACDVALVLTIDPTINGPITNNVRRAVNLHSSPSGIWGPISAVPGYRGQLVNRDVAHGDTAILGTNHFNIEELAQIHQIAIREIKSTLKRRQ